MSHGPTSNSTAKSDGIRILQKSGKHHPEIIVNPTQEGTTQRNYKPGECSVCSKVSTRRQVMRRKKKREEDSTKMIFTTLL
jgi:hypothetical protein